MRVSPFVPFLACLVAACSSDSGNDFVAHFDRPSNLTFACIDKTRAHPLEDCAAKPTADAGPDDPDAMGTAPIGFTVQEAGGDVVITRLNNGDIVDSDPLLPGFNGLPVGTRPVSADTTSDGCFVVVANAGSCDLAAIDVFKSAAPLITTTQGVDLFARDSVKRQVVLNSLGQTLAAAPERIVLGPPSSDGETCPETPVGTAYLSYPRCGKVVAVNLATKTILNSVDFTGETPVIGGPDVTCPVDCRDVENPAVLTSDPASLEPNTLAFEPEGGRVYIGARSSSTLTIASVDSLGAFTSLRVVPLENAGGLTRIAASGNVTMGIGGQLGTHRFVYGIATDNSIRVVDVTPTISAVECDTQIDPRFARSVTDVSKLPCFAVEPTDDPANFPTPNRLRRQSARGPGIRLPGGAMPFDLAFTERLQKPSDNNSEDPPPDLLNGTFVMVTGRNNAQAGVAYIVSVDDDNYPDYEQGDDPQLVDVGRSMPHQLRDGIPGRRHKAPESCATDSVLDKANSGPIRLFNTPAFNNAFGLYNLTVRVISTTWENGLELIVAPPEDPDPSDNDVPVAPRLLPLVHLSTCDPAPKRPSNPDDVDPNVDYETPGIDDDVRVFSLSAQADIGYREVGFPDLQRSRNEFWRVQWEGPLAFDFNDQVQAGGVFATVPGQLALSLADASAPFCTLGVEEGDTVRLTGCEQDFQCAVDEVCYFHPEAPANLLGVCFPASRVEELSNSCRPLLVSNRQYLVQRGAEMLDNKLTLVPRPTVLASSPPDGCSDNQQCRLLYEDEVNRGTRPASTPEAPLTWTCRKDEYLVGAPRCTATCPNNRDEECPTGSVCQDKVCIEGGFPAAECLGSTQSYEIRATESFTVVGSTTGYLHNRLRDMTTGQCVDDEFKDPLRIGRFKPLEAPCDAEDDENPSRVNPCSINLQEPILVFAKANTSESVTGTRKSRGIRFRNWVMRVDIADVVVLQSDPNLPGVLQAAYPSNFSFVMQIGAGFVPLVQLLTNNGNYGFTTFPSRIKRAPNNDVWVVDQGDLDNQRHGALLGIGDSSVLVLQ